MTKVLLVEDDQNISKALSIRLNSVGYDVVLASDAVVAMSQAVQQDPDVVVLDVNLPGGDGFTVANRMKQLDETSDIPLVFITASKLLKFRQQAGQLDAVAFLEKPFSSFDLIEAIERSVA